MSVKRNISAEEVCGKILHDIRHCNLSYDIHDTPDTIVIFIRKKFHSEPKVESITKPQVDEKPACADDRGINGKSDESEYFSQNDTKNTCDKKVTDLKNATNVLLKINTIITKNELKNLRDQYEKGKENYILQNKIRDCQNEVIKMLREEIKVIQSENRKLLQELKNIKYILAPGRIDIQNTTQKHSIKK